VVELLDRGVAIAAQAKKKSGRDSFKWNCVDIQDLWYLTLCRSYLKSYCMGRKAAFFLRAFNLRTTQEHFRVCRLAGDI
jgi:hypothetical protein